MARINEAIRSALGASHMTQAEVARRLGITPQAITPWVQDSEPSLGKIAAIEQALELPAGYLLRSAGYVDEITTAEDAIANDERLKPSDRTLLLQTYRFAVSTNDAAKPPKATLKSRRKS